MGRPRRLGLLLVELDSSSLSGGVVGASKSMVARRRIDWRYQEECGREPDGSERGGVRTDDGPNEKACEEPWSEDANTAAAAPNERTDGFIVMTNNQSDGSCRRVAVLRLTSTCSAVWSTGSAFLTMELSPRSAR